MKYNLFIRGTAPCNIDNLSLEGIITSAVKTICSLLDKDSFFVVTKDDSGIEPVVVWKCGTCGEGPVTMEEARECCNE